MDVITLRVQGRFGVVTINEPSSRNAFTPEMWQALGARVREAATHPEILCTVVTGNGTFYSAGANVKAAGSVFATAAEGNDPVELRATFMKRLAAGNADVARALYEHPKLLVAALNGPAIGLSAGLLGYFDFIYAVEDAYVMTPFTSLGLTAEGGSSQTFVARMGPRAAKEMLIFGKKMTVPELLSCGFINKAFPKSDNATFLRAVLAYLDDQLETLDPDSVLVTKKLINQATQIEHHSTNLREIFEGISRFESGEPQRKFAAIANKTFKHKL